MSLAENIPTSDDELAEVYPLAGDEVSGLRVGDFVPNTGSIAATLDDYEVLSGIREVPFSDFTAPEEPLSARTQELADDISTNGWIAPLIVVVDSKGPYILEGAHRFDALHALDVESFPALVVQDLVD